MAGSPSYPVDREAMQQAAEELRGLAIAAPREGERLQLTEAGSPGARSLNREDRRRLARLMVNGASESEAIDTVLRLHSEEAARGW